MATHWLWVLCVYMAYHADKFLAKLLYRILWERLLCRWNTVITVLACYVGMHLWCEPSVDECVDEGNPTKLWQHRRGCTVCWKQHPAAVTIAPTLPHLVLINHTSQLLKFMEISKLLSFSPSQTMLHIVRVWCIQYGSGCKKDQNTAKIRKNTLPPAFWQICGISDKKMEWLWQKLMETNVVCLVSIW